MSAATSWTLLFAIGASAKFEVLEPAHLRATLPTAGGKYMGPQRFWVNASLILLDWPDAKWLDTPIKDGDDPFVPHSEIGGATCAPPQGTDYSHGILFAPAYPEVFYCDYISMSTALRMSNALGAIKLMPFSAGLTWNVWGDTYVYVKRHERPNNPPGHFASNGIGISPRCENDCHESDCLDIENGGCGAGRQKQQ